MSKVCVFCGKSKMKGATRSKSNIKTNRTYSANLHKVDVEINGKASTEYVCTKCLKTSKKNAQQA